MNKFLRIPALAVIFCFLANISQAAEITEVPVTVPAAPSEMITTQIVKPTDPVAPYSITGEALVKLITQMVSFDTEGSTIVFNRATGQIIIKNTPSNLSKIEDIIADMRKAVRRQVDIEARILTVTADDINSLGIELADLDVNAYTDSNEKGLITTDFAGQNILFPDVAERADSSAFFGQEYAFKVLGKHGNFEAIIDALKSKAEVNTLAAPRLTVFNNQRAHIKIADYRTFVSEVDGEIEARDNALFFQVTSKTRRAPAGTLLDVTPTINHNGTITLTIHPTFVRADLTTVVSLATVARAVDDDTATLGENSVTLPVFTEQSIDTSVVIPDGGMAMLGGLIDEVETKTKNKIPFFGDIPLVGTFFKNEQNRDQKSHLMIFIKATSKYVDSYGKLKR